MYPVMLCVKGRRCLVVGGGGVALRKAQALVEEGGSVTVVAPELVPQFHDMARLGRIFIEERSYRPGEAAEYALVFAATDDREVNIRIFEDADGAGVWANVADDPEICSFQLPARIQRNALQIAVGSAGEAPFAVRRIRQLLERRLGPEWGEWLEAAARFRNRVRRRKLSHAEQETAFDSFFNGTVDGESLRARVPSATEEESWLHPDGAERGALEISSEEQMPVTGGCGRVSLVGSGPGCAGLLTLRGWKLLQEADAVVYDRLAAAALPCDLPPEVELHCVGKEAGRHPVAQTEINAQLVRLAREGKRVVRLKGGDPYVFGRGGEEAEALEAAGIPFDIVPGVTSGIAAPAWMGIPVTHRGEAVRLTFLTAHEMIKSDGPQVRWDLLAQDPHATLIGYMGVTTLPQVVERLLAAGMDPAMPAAMVERGTTAAQRCTTSTVAELPAAVEREGIKPPALFIIGPTVRHAERLNWFARQPQAGERLVLPAIASELARTLELAGAEVLAVPTPVSPAARIVMGAAPLTGCVLRSPAEVDWLDEEREGPGWESESVTWCVGKESADRARERGWRHVVMLQEELGSEEIMAAIARRRGSAGRPS
jgi:uroporphyrin-III C-methyltransferase/precorrin-2 dehydrogenase/sirohydrochlorin ferrochelatase